MEFLRYWLWSCAESWRVKPLGNMVALTAVLSAVFILVPAIDIEVSRFFYVEGQGFPARSVDVLRTTRAIGQYFPLSFCIVMVVGLLLKLAYPSRPCLFPPRFMVYFATLFLLGPGLLVNLVLKPFWDRPRPVGTLDFGGAHMFVKAWSMGGELFANRSFVSGETAGVVCLLPLALFVHPQWRRTIFVLLAAFATIVSFNRIAFGAHFLSDVMIAAGLTGALSIGLWRLVYSDPAQRFADAAMEGVLTRAGLGLRKRAARLAFAVAATARICRARFAFSLTRSAARS